MMMMMMTVYFRKIVVEYPGYVILACESICYAVARPSVCPPVTRVDQSKTVEVIIMQLSPQSNPVTLVSCGSLDREIPKGI